ncbi:MAG: aminotransferase class I/II-fold pyridoxal phosphate-dependent enzyme [Syntrophomonadaceae bacterium]|nr:aminotransferase class I/II-fold pyridoxal phosphate-dependent enzyme [Syntrophomonadaceae bacterium]MDD3890538.1 aminotransferase class I/II-fold pyridoxal phosphate-dependent enzyme [Syntrophomonadaceae bacterium]MDD4550006.1 aminotransferase class I/II-fold pyridoxal phosphate-dependent enzyme [Syntrophomonadaceae bacterium]
MFRSLTEIDDLLKKHNDYRDSCLNLIASENCASSTVRGYLNTKLSNRYGCYESMHPENREYTGNKFIHQFEMEVQELVGEIFKAPLVDLRPIGGHISGVATVLGTLQPGELLFEIHLKDWGHGLVGPMLEAPQFRETIRIESIPYSDHMIDLDKLISMIYEKKPRLIIFGSSGMLFPEPIKEIKAITEKEGIILAMDSSHINGLIAGGVFPNPLEEGVDIMFGSLHKTFPGPEGGFILAKDPKLFKRIGDIMSSALVTSHHLYRLPALAAAMLEMKQFGKAYGEQVIKNARALGKAMDELGFKVVAADRGYTSTHLILVDVTEFGGCKKVARQLEAANVLCSDDFGQLDKEIRIGTAEVTRRGMKETEMKTVAEFFKRVLMGNESSSFIAQKVKEFSSSYSHCDFGF